MDFEWDEAKRERVLAERKIDLLDMTALFDGRPVFSYRSDRGEEERFVTIGSIENRFYAVVWTIRDSSIRLISARRARDVEERKHHQTFSR